MAVDATVQQRQRLTERRRWAALIENACAPCSVAGQAGLLRAWRGAALAAESSLSGGVGGGGAPAGARPEAPGGSLIRPETRSSGQTAAAVAGGGAKANLEPRRSQLIVSPRPLTLEPSQPMGVAARQRAQRVLGRE